MRWAALTVGLAMAACGRVEFDPLASADAAAALRTYRDVVLEDVPLSYWRLGDAAGVRAADETGRLDGAYEGTCTLGASGALTGDPNTALLLDASTCRIVLPTQTPFDGNASFSLEAWALHTDIPTTSGLQVYVMNETRDMVGPTDGYALLLANIGGVYIERAAGGSNRFTPRTVVTVQAWHHVVGTYDGTTLALYVDGAPKGTNANALASVDSTGALSYLGAQTTLSPSGIVHGRLDEVAIYDHVLSAERVAEHYRVGTTGPE